MLHLSCVTTATAATSAPASRRGLHRARPPAPRQARNSRVSRCARAAPPFYWSHCARRLHADSKPRFACAHSGVAGWQGWGGGAGRCTVASSACCAGDHAAAAAPSCARTPRKLAHALMFSSGAVCQRRVRVAICTLCIHCRVHTLACVARVCRSLQSSAFMLQPPPRAGGVASWPVWQYQAKLVSLQPLACLDPRG